MSENPPSPSPFERWLKYLPLLIFAIAFGYRLIGIGWGLPNELHNQSYHPDEQVIWVSAQQIKPAQLDFTPGFYNYGTFYLTLLRVSSDMVAAYSGGVSAQDPGSLWDYMGRCHLAGRWISALAGAGLAVVLFLMVRRFGNVLGATIAALAIAFAPALVVHSRFQTVDMLATFLLALGSYFALLLIPREGEEAPSGKDLVKWGVLAGVFIGLSAGTKYTGILGLLTLVVAAFYLHRGARPSEAVRSAALGIGAAFLTFLLVTPGVLLDSGAFWRDFRYEMAHTSTGHGLVFTEAPSGFLYHISNVLAGYNVLMTVLSVIALVWALWRRQPVVVALAAFGLVYYLLIGRAEVLFLRYTFPLYISLAAGIGWLTSQAHEKKGLSIAWVIFALFGLGTNLMAATQWTGIMATEDVRDRLAKKYREEKGSLGIVSDPWFYTPPFIPDSTIMRGNYGLLLEEMATSWPPLVQYIPEDGPDARLQWDPRLITEVRPDRIVFSSFEVGDVARLSGIASRLPEEDRRTVERFIEFHRLLEQEYELEGTAPSGLMLGGDLRQRYVWSYASPHDLQYVQPILYLWKLKTNPSQNPSNGSSTTSESSGQEASTR